MAFQIPHSSMATNRDWVTLFCISIVKKHKTKVGISRITKRNDAAIVHFTSLHTCNLQPVVDEAERICTPTFKHWSKRRLTKCHTLAAYSQKWISLCDQRAAHQPPKQAALTLMTNFAQKEHKFERRLTKIRPYLLADC